jgi:hypothetical protein
VAPIGPRASAAERDPVEQHNIIANLRGLPNDCTHPVVDEQPAANRRRRVNLDASPATRPICNDPSEKILLAPPQQMRTPMQPYGMKPWIRQQHLGLASRSRVLAQHHGNVFAYACPHGVRHASTKSANNAVDR